jgi:hypothetical protein
VKLGARTSADCGGRSGKPALRPVRDRSQDRFECAAARGQSIAHPDRRPRVDKPLHDAFGLELAQALSQNAIADAGDSGEELVESSRCRYEGFHHCPGPTLSDQLDSALKGSAVVEAPSDHGE